MFNISNTNFVNMPLAGYFKPENKMCSSKDKQKEETEEIPYSSVVESFIYVLVYIRLDIVHVIGVMSRYLSKSKRKH